MGIHKTVTILAVVGSLVYVLLSVYNGYYFYDRNIIMPCPSVLSAQRYGLWQTRPLTEKEDNEIETFLRESLFTGNSFPLYEGTKNACGNISYFNETAQNRAGHWHRVLCNPRGDNPCCYNNRCVKKAVGQCVCSECYDLRTEVHAEYSKWIPNDDRCQIENFTSQSACELLKGGTYHFYGDSLVRMMFLAFIIILKGDNLHGGLRPDTPKEEAEKCSGMYVFPIKNCRRYLDYSPTLCNGTVKAMFKMYTQGGAAPRMVKDVTQILDRPRSMILYGCGMWSMFNTNDVERYALSVIHAVHNGTDRQWPKLVWSGIHHYGLWRRHHVKAVDFEHAESFNRHMEAVVGKYNVPMFDTFNMTRGVRSVDSIHFGPGVNFLKAQIYLNYIKELQTKGNWD
ncbi:uncharacterized protein LOC124290510 isoform X3 [Haliotis rubra]|uniref:uncharacterized protein LOC124290510 isoform X3 n=1 Tax=Haliotis rubra TaxID=36100 RepID=UPI001EE5CBC0|nr:uncharacterized protein LOC124290510 isoform X3 [Haliotis rubra]